MTLILAGADGKFFIFVFKAKCLRDSSCLSLVSQGILEGKIVLKHIYFKDQTHSELCHSLLQEIFKTQ